MAETQQPTTSEAPVMQVDGGRIEIPDTANYAELAGLEPVEREGEPPSPTPTTEPTTPVPSTGGEPKPSGEQPQVTAPVPVAEPPKPATPQPVAQPTATPAPAPQPQPTTAEVPKAPTVEEIQQHRNQLLTSLEQMYALPKEEADEVLTAPEKVLPRLAARITANVFDGILQTVGQNLPVFIENYMRGREVQASAWDGFAGKYPMLNKPEYYPTITQVSKVFQQLNPQVRGDEAFKHIALQTAMLLGLDPTTLVAAPAAPVATPSAPTPQPQPRMHTPANPGASASGNGRAVTNEYELISREFESLRE